MTRPTRFLVRMGIFLTLVAIAAVFMLDAVARAFLANPALNGLILGVLLIGAFHAFRRAGLLFGEIAWIESFRRRGIEPPISHPRLLATVASAMTEREGQVRLTAISMRSLLDGISARLDESGELSRYFVGLAIFLGLLGTFWGLLETVASVGDVIGGLQVGGDPEAVFGGLKAGLEAPLQGMGTAFSSSLFGLASALVLGFLDLQANQAQNHFFNELEDWLASVTRHAAGGVVGDGGEGGVPIYIQALLEQTAETMEDLRRTVGRAEEGRQASNQGLQALTEKLGTLTSQVQAEQSLLVRLAQQQIDMQPILARLSERLEESARMDPQALNYLHNIDYRLASLVEDVHTGREEVRNDIRILTRTVSMLQPDGRR